MYNGKQYGNYTRTIDLYIFWCPLGHNMVLKSTLTNVSYILDDFSKSVVRLRVKCGFWCLTLKGCCIALWSSYGIKIESHTHENSYQPHDKSHWERIYRSYFFWLLSFSAFLMLHGVLACFTQYNIFVKQ